MFSNAKIAQSALVVLALGAFSLAPSTASAGLFSDIGHAVKSVGKAVAHPAKLAKDIGHDVGSAAKEVAHPKQLVRDTEHAIRNGAIGKTLRAVGGVVGDAYDGAAKLSKNIPIAKDFRPLMRDAARAARSSEGQIAAAAGVGLAIATGGGSYAATQAGGWGYAAFIGKREIKRAPAQIKSVSRI